MKTGRGAQAPRQKGKGVQVMTYKEMKVKTMEALAYKDKAALEELRNTDAGLFCDILIHEIYKHYTTETVYKIWTFSTNPTICEACEAVLNIRGFEW